MFEQELKELIQDNIGALTNRYVNQKMSPSAFEKLKVEEESEYHL